MNKTKNIALAASAAGLIGFSGAALSANIPLAFPGAVADAYLQTSSFTFLRGNGAHGKGTDLVLGTDITVAGAGTTSDVSASLGGASDDAGGQISVGIGAGFTHTATVGAAGEFDPTTTIPVGFSNTGTYAASHSSAEGLAITTAPFMPTAAGAGDNCGAGPLVGDCNTVHNQVNLTEGNVGSATSNQTFTTSATINVMQAGLFEVNFDADGYIRAALGQLGESVEATISWTMTITNLTQNGPSLIWNPDGVVGNTSCFNPITMVEDCVEYADGFNLTETIGHNLPVDVTGLKDPMTLMTDPESNNGDPGDASGLGEFEIEMFLGVGAYAVSIRHSTLADARIVVPEPATLALMGIGLLGAGAARRQKK